MDKSSFNFNTDIESKQYGFLSKNGWFGAKVPSAQELSKEERITQLKHFSTLEELNEHQVERCLDILRLIGNDNGPYYVKEPTFQTKDFTVTVLKLMNTNDSIMTAILRSKKERDKIIQEDPSQKDAESGLGWASFHIRACDGAFNNSLKQIQLLQENVYSLEEVNQNINTQLSNILKNNENLSAKQKNDISNLQKNLKEALVKKQNLEREIDELKAHSSGDEDEYIEDSCDIEQDNQYPKAYDSRQKNNNNNNNIIIKNQNLNNNNNNDNIIFNNDDDYEKGLEQTLDDSIQKLPISNLKFKKLREDWEMFKTNVAKGNSLLTGLIVILRRENNSCFQSILEALEQHSYTVNNNRDLDDNTNEFSILYFEIKRLSKQNKLLQELLDQALSVVNTANNQLSNNDLVASIQKLKEKLMSAEENVEQITLKYNQLQPKNFELSNTNNVLKAELEKNKQALQKLQKDLNDAEANFQQATTACEKYLATIGQNKISLKDKNDQINDLTSTISKLENESNALKTQLYVLKQNESKLSSQISTLKTETKQLNDQIQSLESNQSQNQQQVIRLNEMTQALNEMTQALDRVTREKDAASNQIKELERQMGILNLQVSARNLKLNESESTILKLKKERDKYQQENINYGFSFRGKKEKMSELRKEVEEYQKQLKALEREKTEIEEKLAGTEKSLTNQLHEVNTEKASSLASVADLEKQLSELREQHQGIQNQIESLNNEKDQLSELLEQEKQDKSRIVKELADTRAEVNSLKNESEKTKSQIETLQNQLQHKIEAEGVSAKQVEETKQQHLNAISELEKKLSETSELLKTKETEYTQLQQAASANANQLTSFSQSLQWKDEQITKLQQKQKELEENNQQLTNDVTKERQKLNEAESRHTDAAKQFEEAQKELNDQLKTVQSELEQVNKARSDAQNELNAAQLELKESKKLNGELTQQNQLVVEQLNSKTEAFEKAQQTIVEANKKLQEQTQFAEERDNLVQTHEITISGQQETINTQADELRLLQERISALMQENELLKTQHKSVMKENDTLRQTIEERTARIAQLESMLEELQANNAQLSTKVETTVMSAEEHKKVATQLELEKARQEEDMNRLNEEIEKTKHQLANANEESKAKLQAALSKQQAELISNLQTQVVDFLGGYDTRALQAFFYNKIVNHFNHPDGRGLQDITLTYKPTNKKSDWVATTYVLNLDVLESISKGIGADGTFRSALAEVRKLKDAGKPLTVKVYQPNTNNKRKSIQLPKNNNNNNNS